MLHDYENKTAARIAEAREQIASVQERIRGVEENVGDFTSRLVKVEQSMLMGSTIQFKDLDIVEKFNKESTSMKDGQDEMKTMENQIDNLIKTKNTKAEKRLGIGKAKANTPLTGGDSLFPELVESPIGSPNTTVIKNPKTPQTDSKSSGDQFFSAKSSLDIGGRPINPTVDKMQGPKTPLLLTNLLDSNLKGEMPDGYHNVGYGMDDSYLPPRNKGMDVGSNMFATQKPYDINLPSQGFPASNPVPPAQQAFDFSKPLPTLPNQDQVFNRLPTGPQQQPRVSIDPKDSSDASRGRKKKRYRHEYSRSPSEESPDRALTQSRVRDRSRSPPPQKMPIFTGKGDLTWESFIYRFERTASRRCWDEAKKTSRLFVCLSDGALEFGRRAGSDRSYEELRRLLKHRFSRKEEPSSARRQLQYIRQLDTKTLEEYAERVHFLALDGFCNNSGDVVDQIGT